MKPCKRIEVVIERAVAAWLAGLLLEAGAPGYTFIDHASGRGDRGERRGDEPAGTSTNCMFIVACNDDAVVERIIDAVRPTLSRYGGICLVSEAFWLRH